jgi:outer membrane protein assembly factor BamE (lipoprotein component of BamABCDE complex)
MTPIHINHKDLKHEKYGKAYIIYTSLEKIGETGFPDHVVVHGKQYHVIFDIEKVAKDHIIYKPSDESKLDVPSCRNYGLVIFMNEKDVP